MNRLMTNALAIFICTAFASGVAAQDIHPAEENVQAPNREYSPEKPRPCGGVFFGPLFWSAIHSQPTALFSAHAQFPGPRTTGAWL
jgi:hypothetical protein